MVSVVVVCCYLVIKEVIDVVSGVRIVVSSKLVINFVIFVVCLGWYC